MEKIVLGRTGIAANKNGFGALPIQRITMDEAKYLLHKAADNGFNYFDTARNYTDSEEKIGRALGGIRSKIYIATKTAALTAKEFWCDLETSLQKLRTDYIDVYQFHNPPFCPKPDDGSGLCEAMLKAKSEGKIRFISITNHRMPVALEAVKSGFYDTLQFPFCYLANEADIELSQKCADANMGFIAMKALAGGLITDSAAAFAFMARFKNILPIWGVQKERELNEFISYVNNPPQMTPEREKLICSDKEKMNGSFCHGCGYCLPCVKGINIPFAARMSQVIRRMPAADYLTPEWQEAMSKTRECINCGICKKRCPYGMDIPKLLKENYEDYKTFLHETE